MRSWKFRSLAILVATGISGAALFQTPGCSTFVATSAISALDFCAILDCQNGLLGGLIRPCGSPLSTTDDILADCQNFTNADGG